MLETETSKEPYNKPLAEENRWRASRHGMDAVFYNAATDASVPARDAARNLVEELRPHAQDLGCEDELEGILDIVNGGTGSRRQREIYEESGEFLDVVAYLIEDTRPALAEEPN